MVVIHPHQSSVTLFSRHGNVWSYPSLKAALAALGYSWIVEHVGEQFRMFSHQQWLHPAGYPATVGYRITGGSAYSEAVYAYHDYVMRDDCGSPLTASDFQSLHRAQKKKSRRYDRYAFWNGEGPVPGISKPKAGYHYYRRVRHMNARRGTATFVEEGEVPPRAKRNLHHLPNPWDDYQVAKREDRSWKRHRRTQYRVKAP